MDDVVPTDRAVALSLIGEALATLSKITSTGVEKIDAEIMAAEQALRRAKKKLKPNDE